MLDISAKKLMVPSAVRKTTLSLTLSMAAILSSSSCFAPALAAPVSAPSSCDVQREVLPVVSEKTSDGKNYVINKVLIDATPEDVFAVIVDYKNSGKLFANLTKSDVVAHDAEKNTTDVSFSLKGMLNLWSFDYVLSIKETYPNLIEFHRVSGAFKRNEGYWKLTPVDGGKQTEVVYAKYVDSVWLCHHLWWLKKYAIRRPA